MKILNMKEVDKFTPLDQIIYCSWSIW